MRDLGRIRCCIYRGGTSRGVFFHAADLPADPETRARICLGILGSPDIRQIDGLGGATSHTSKVVVVHPSGEKDVDIEYEFLQIAVDKPLVDPKGMCGNLLSAAGLFAVDEGLVSAREPWTTVRVRNALTRMSYRLDVPVQGGRSVTQGDYHIDGVPRPGAPIIVEFLDPAGTVTGKLLPTGKATDVITTGRSSYVVSLVDAGHIHLCVRLSDLGIQGGAPLSELQGRGELLEELERLRGKAAQLCGFVENPEDAATRSPARPRTCLVGPPEPFLSLYGRRVESSEMDFRSLTVSMGRFHQSIPLSTSICLAAAAAIPGTVVQDISIAPAGWRDVRIGHPSGTIEIAVERSSGSDATPRIDKVIAKRTARRLMDGFAYYPM